LEWDFKLSEVLSDSLSVDERQLSDTDLLALWRSLRPAVATTVDAVTGRRTSVTTAPEIVYRAKVIIVGNERAGKTSLLNALQEVAPDACNAENAARYVKRKEKGKLDPVTTYGIDVVPMLVAHPDHSDRDIQFNFWDFGGQKTYYVSHQLFLTLRTIYIVCFDGNADQSGEKLHFWLNSLASFGGDGDGSAAAAAAAAGSLPVEQRPTVLLVATKKDLTATPLLDSITRECVEKYGDRLNIVDSTVFSVSSNFEANGSGQCKAYDGVLELKQKLVATAKAMPDIEQQMNSKWLQVEKAVCGAAAAGGDAATPKTLQWFEAECKKHDVVDGWHALLRRLYFWGGLHVIGDGAGQQMIFPHPPWLMSALRTVISHGDPIRKQFTRGAISTAAVRQLLSPVAKTELLQSQLIGIMKKFGLVFALSADQLLFPCHLTDATTLDALLQLPHFPAASPDDDDDDDNSAAIGFRVCHEYQLSFAPEHLFFQFIDNCYDFIYHVRDGDEKQSTHFIFNNAVVLRQGSAGSVAVVVFNAAERKVTLNVRGQFPLLFMRELTKRLQATLSKPCYSNIRVEKLQASCPVCLDQHPSSHKMFGWQSTLLQMFDRDKIQEYIDIEKESTMCEMCEQKLPCDELLLYILGETTTARSCKAIAATAAVEVAEAKKPAVVPVKAEEDGKEEKEEKKEQRPVMSASKSMHESTQHAKDERERKALATQAIEHQGIMSMLQQVLAQQADSNRQRDAMMADAKRVEEEYKLREVEAKKVAEANQKSLLVQLELERKESAKRFAVLENGQKRLLVELERSQAAIVGQMSKLFLAHSETAVPSMAVLIPRGKDWKEKLQPMKWVKDMFQLHLMCERPGSEHLLRSPESELIAGWEVEMPKALVASCAPYLSILLKLAQAALKIIPLVNLSISDDTIASVETCGKNLREHLPDVQKDIDAAQKKRRESKSTQKQQKQKQGGEEGLGKALPDTAVEMCSSSMDPEERNRVAVRQLQAWIEQLDAGSHKYQDLTRTLNGAAFVWCCAECRRQLRDKVSPAATDVSDSSSEPKPTATTTPTMAAGSPVKAAKALSAAKAATAAAAAAEKKK
jgi:GTPase SAR1 family protein